MAWEQLIPLAGQLLGGKGGAPAGPAISGIGQGGQMLDMGNYGMQGLPAWNRNNGGNGQPPQAQAFRPDSLVMGLTGLSTTTSSAAGNGLAATQPHAFLNTAPFQTTNILIIGAIVLGVLWLKK